MTGKDIQELFQKELGLYEFIEDVQYDEKTKELSFEILMNFDEECSKNPLFHRQIDKKFTLSDDLELCNYTRKAPTMIFTVKNKTITAEINTPFEGRLFDCTKSVFEEYLHKWGVY